MRKEFYEIDDAVYQLDQLNSLLAFIQTTYSEGCGYEADREETEMALYHIYEGNRAALEKIHKAMEGWA